MTFFVDTNIPLGYTIIHDKFHDPSKNFIEDNEDIFWSNLVKKEYTEKLDALIDDIEIFLKIAENELKENMKDFPSYYTFEKYVLKRTKRCSLNKTKKQKILTHFWDKYNIIEGISEPLYLNFKNFNKNFKKMYLKRDKELHTILKLHNCGIDNYKKYYGYAKQLYEWGVHKPDCKIITDAHDCGLTHEGLTFVSNDAEMLEIIINHSTSFLKIMEFKSCT